MLFISMLSLACAVGVAGYFAGHMTGKRDRIPKPERAELEQLRELRSTLLRDAAQHIAIGDSTFAPIVLDEIEKNRRKSL